MTFQTTQKNQANRYKNSSEELSNEICPIQLGRKYVVRTFGVDETDEDELDHDIELIRQLFDEGDGDGSC